MIGDWKMEVKNASRRLRDGSNRQAQGWRSWPEKIARGLEPVGTEKRGLWFSHSGIVKRLRERGERDIPASLSTPLLWLVKRGYLERAKRPVKAGKVDYGDYIYRRTGKAYVAPVMGAKMVSKPDIRTGFEIYQANRKLPKWFRDMMQ